MATTKIVRQAIAKSLSRISNTSEQKILGILNTPKVALKQQFGVPIPRLAAHESNAVNYCEELASKVIHKTFHYVA